MRIVLCYPVESRHCQQIAAAAPQAEIINAGQEQIAAELFTADIFCGHAKVPVDWDGVVRQGRLKWIQSSAAGMDHCLLPSVIASQIVVTSASGVLANQVAEHAIALIMAWLRSLPVFFRAQQAKEFVRRPTRDLHGAHRGHRGIRRRGTAVGPVVAALPDADPGHRPVSRRSAGGCPDALAGRPAARSAGGVGRGGALLAPERQYPRADRRPGPGTDEAHGAYWPTWPGGRWW